MENTHIKDKSKLSKDVWTFPPLRRAFVLVILLGCSSIGAWLVYSESGQPLLGNLYPRMLPFRRFIGQSLQSERPPQRYSMAFEVNENFSYYYKTVSSHPNEIFRKVAKIQQLFPEAVPVTSNTSKLIVYMNTAGWYRGMEMSTCEEGFKTCPIKTCTCTNDSSKIPNADAVFIDGVELREKTPPPKSSSQVWILFGIESPNYFSSHLYKTDQWKAMFNWTMTYRLDSDIPTPYGILHKRLKPPGKNYEAIARTKTGSAVWLVGNCNTPGKRERYVERLKKIYNVDVFGRCGQKRNVDLKETLKNYRFYLSFENGLCFDYITEKLFKTYRDDIDIIPIVRGGANYSVMIPNGTYINSADFDSPESLGKHLKYLEGNVTAYAEHLKRHDEYIINGGTRLANGFCDICVKLHHLEQSYNHYTDVGSWINKGICRNSTDI